MIVKVYCNVGQLFWCNFGIVIFIGFLKKISVLKGSASSSVVVYDISGCLDNGLRYRNNFFTKLLERGKRAGKWGGEGVGGEKGYLLTPSRPNLFIGHLLTKFIDSFLEIYWPFIESPFQNLIDPLLILNWLPYICKNPWKNGSQFEKSLFINIRYSNLFLDWTKHIILFIFDWCNAWWLMYNSWKFLYEKWWTKRSN